MGTCAGGSGRISVPWDMRQGPTWRGLRVTRFWERRRPPLLARCDVDYSTYVTIDNSAGSSDLVLTDASAIRGHYVVPPPVRVRRGKTARFWVQDYPGGAGSRGNAIYRNDSGTVTLSFACPTGVSPNVATGAAFRGKSGGDADYGPINAVPKFGHPFFVQFMT